MTRSYPISGWWFGTFFIFPYIGSVIIPTDELIFFRGVGSTTNQHMLFGPRTMSQEKTAENQVIMVGFLEMIGPTVGRCFSPYDSFPLNDSMDWFRGKNYRKTPYLMVKTHGFL